VTPPTFEQALSLTSQLLDKISSGSISDDQSQVEIETITSTVAGARGFFVSLLTGEFGGADQPPQFLIRALEKHKDIVGDLLTKNIVMATSMKIIHQRNNDGTAALGSQRVITRASNLALKLDKGVTIAYVAKMQAALLASLAVTQSAEENNEYIAFLSRWKYDDEQKRLALKAIESLSRSLIQQI
jgi:hypothetical protein